MLSRAGAKPVCVLCDGPLTLIGQAEWRLCGCVVCNIFGPAEELIAHQGLWAALTSEASLAEVEACLKEEV